MPSRRLVLLRLDDMIDAAERVREVLGNLPLDDLEADWQRQWLLQRGIEIISEASRYLPDDIKARHPEIPWIKVAGIGNALRPGYESISAPCLGSLCARISRSLSRRAAPSAQRSGPMLKSALW